MPSSLSSMLSRSLLSSLIWLAVASTLLQLVAATGSNSTSDDAHVEHRDVVSNLNEVINPVLMDIKSGKLTQIFTWVDLQAQAAPEASFRPTETEGTVALPGWGKIICDSVTSCALAWNIILRRILRAALERTQAITV